MKIIFFCIATLVVAVAIIANSNTGHHLLGFVRLIPGKDVTGHFCLYAALGTASSFFLKRAGKKSYFLWFGAISALVIAEEFSQAFIPRRTFSLLDLAASLSGLWIGFSTSTVYSSSYNLRRWFLGLLINQAVPTLNLFRQGLAWDTAFSELREFPEHSWGREIFCFLNDRNLTFLPKYEHHDALHVLLGYDMTVLGEARLQAFMVGNQTPTYAGRGLYILASLLLPEHQRLLDLDRSRGQNTAMLDWLAIEDSLCKPLNAVRASWEIQSFPDMAISDVQ